jgi:hypothetical protein
VHNRSGGLAGAADFGRFKSCVYRVGDTSGEEAPKTIGGFTLFIGVALPLSAGILKASNARRECDWSSVLVPKQACTLGCAPGQKWLQGREGSGTIAGIV